jgi:hypothetical protein
MPLNSRVSWTGILKGSDLRSTTSRFRRKFTAKFCAGGVAFMASLFFSSSLFTGCVTTPSGQKKFEPWEAAQRVDESIDVWMEKHSF